MLLNLNQHASKKYCQPLVHVAIHRDRSLFPWKDCPILSQFLWTICPRRTRSIPNEKVCFPHRYAYQRVQGFSCMERAQRLLLHTFLLQSTPLCFVLSMLSCILSLSFCLFLYLFHTCSISCAVKMPLISNRALHRCCSAFCTVFCTETISSKTVDDSIRPKHLRAVFLYFHTLAQNWFSLLSLLTFPVLLPTCLPVVNLLLLTSFSHPTLRNVVCAHHTVRHWIGNWSFIRTSLRYIQVIFCYCFQMSSSE